jgi:hypothetical protein
MILKICKKSFDITYLEKPITKAVRIKIEKIKYQFSFDFFQSKSTLF